MNETPETPRALAARARRLGHTGDFATAHALLDQAQAGVGDGALASRDDGFRRTEPVRFARLAALAAE